MRDNSARIHLHAGMTCQLSYYTVQLQDDAYSVLLLLKSGWWKPIKFDKFVMVLINH